MMTNEVKTETPKVELATKDWTMKEFIDSERRIEKAFHKQTQFLSKETGELKREIANQTKWTVGLIATMAFAIIIAVLFKN